MIVKTAVNFITLFFLLSIVFVVKPAVGTTPPKQEATSAQESWLYYASDENDAAYAFNPTNIERLKDNHVKVWVKVLYPETNPKYKEGQFRWELNCAKKTMRGLTATATNKDGTATTIMQSSDWSPIPVESTAEILFERMCKKEEKKK